MLLLAEASWFSSQVSTQVPNAYTRGLPLYEKNIPMGYCEEMIASKDCDICTACSLKKEDCTNLFNSHICWPEPTQPVCKPCVDMYGTTIFPGRMLAKGVLPSSFSKGTLGAQQRTTFKNVGRVMVDESMCTEFSAKGICSFCEECHQSDAGYKVCKDMFHTQECWPVPTLPRCFKCFETFGTDVFP